MYKKIIKIFNKFSDKNDPLLDPYPFPTRLSSVLGGLGPPNPPFLLTPTAFTAILSYNQKRMPSASVFADYAYNIDIMIKNQCRDRFW